MRDWRYPHAGTGLLSALLIAALAGCAEREPDYGPAVRLDTSAARQLDAPLRSAEVRWKGLLELDYYNMNPAGFATPLADGGLMVWGSWPFLVWNGAGELQALPLPTSPGSDHTVYSDHRFEQLPDGGFAAALGPPYGASKDQIDAGSFLYRVGPDGKLLWKSLLPVSIEAQHRSYAVTLRSDQTLAVVLRDAAGKASLVAFNLDGRQLDTLPTPGLELGNIRVGPTGSYYQYVYLNRYVKCFDQQGQREWRARLPDPDVLLEVTPLDGPDGVLLVEGCDGLYLLDAGGKYLWHSPLDWSFDRRVALLPAGDQLAVADGAHLHFLDLAGQAAAAPFAVAADNNRQGEAGWEWWAGRDGWLYIDVYPDLLADRQTRYLYAVSPQGEPQWKAELPGNFDLICATSDGLIYGTEHHSTVDQHRHGATVEEYWVCLEAGAELPTTGS